MGEAKQVQLRMGRYRQYFLKEEEYMPSKLLDPETEKKAIAVLKRYLPENSSDRVRVIHFAMTYFLRYASCFEEPISEVSMVACVSLAMKHRKKGLDISKHFHGLNSTKIGKMEFDISRKLKWTFHPLTPILFINVFKVVFPTTLNCNKSTDRIAYQLILEAHMINALKYKRPSLLGMSALLVATNTNPSLVHPDLDIEPACITDVDLKECVDIMRTVYKGKESVWNNTSMGELEPFDFEVDWLRNFEITGVNLDALRYDQGDNDKFLTFCSQSREHIFKINPTLKIEENLPVFDEIYQYIWEEDEKEGISYIVRIPNSKSKEKSKLRDNLESWLSMSHKNIVRCQDVVVTPDGRNIFVVFKYFPNHLIDALKYISATERVIYVKRMMHQLLNGIAYYHKKLGPHYHIRPESILVIDNEAQIADFCLDKSSSKLRGRYDTNITYRAPEILLGIIDKKDETPADIWALGCVFWKLLTGEHLFEGVNDIERAKSIFSRLGTPSKENWECVFNRHEKALSFYGNKKVEDLNTAFCPKGEGIKVSEDEVQLLPAMLVLDPKERVTAEKALKYQYFTDFPDVK